MPKARRKTSRRHEAAVVDDQAPEVPPTMVTDAPTALSDSQLNMVVEKVAEKLLPLLPPRNEPEPKDSVGAPIMFNMQPQYPLMFPGKLEVELPMVKFSLKYLLHEDGWKVVLENEFEKPYFQMLEDKLNAEYKAGKQIFPPKHLIFNAFNLTPFDKVKVVILGQDPYHQHGKAMGLSFSVPHGVKVPASLMRMFKELFRDPLIADFQIPKHGCLEEWTKEGVLLLNCTLTVEEGKPNSHSTFGWQTFTDNVIKAISDHCDGVVFLLMGVFAKRKEYLIDHEKHYVVTTAHPSPRSYRAKEPFIGSNGFSDCNTYHTINWGLQCVMPLQ